MEIEQLSTNRLLLRKIDIELISHIYSNYSDHKLIEFLGLKSKSNLEEEKNKYNQGLWTYNKKFLYFQLIKKQNNEIIGWCGYHTWYTDHNRAEIGYGIFEDSNKKKGYMKEALSKIINYGFLEMKLNRIEAFIGPENTGSKKLVENLKFVKEGLLKSHYVKYDIAEDSLVYALLRKHYIPSVDKIY